MTDSLGRTKTLICVESAFPFWLVTSFTTMEQYRISTVLKSFVYVNTVFIGIYPLLVLQCPLNPRLHQDTKKYSQFRFFDFNAHVLYSRYHLEIP